MTEVNCGSGLELKDGECYLNRDGEVVGPLEPCDISRFPFKAYHSAEDSDGFECYTRDGRWGFTEDDPRDLVSYLPRFYARHPEFQRNMDQIMQELLGEEPEFEKEPEPDPEQLTLQVGEYYLNRKGDVIGPMKKGHGLKNRLARYPFGVDNLTYCRDGKYYNKVDLAEGEDVFDEEDLIEHIPITDKRHPEFSAKQEWIDTQVGTPKFTSCCIDSDGNLRLTLLVGANAIAFKFAPPVRYVP